jgi:hypothetical protein
MSAAALQPSAPPNVSLSSDTGASNSKDVFEAAEAPPKPQYSADFPIGAESDVLLQASDGVYFATQQLFLRAASSVFRDTLLVGSDCAPSAETFEGLPVIKLAEFAFTIQRFLALIQSSPVVAPSVLITIQELDKLLTMCDKYDAPLAGRWAALRFFPGFLESTGQMHFIALTLIHAQYKTRHHLEAAIRRLNIGVVKQVDASAPHFMVKTEMKRVVLPGFRSLNVSDIPSECLRRMAIEDVVEISRLQMKVAEEDKYNYDQAAKDFTVSWSSPLRSRPRTTKGLIGLSPHQVHGYP